MTAINQAQGRTYGATCIITHKVPSNPSTASPGGSSHVGLEEAARTAAVGGRDALAEWAERGHQLQLDVEAADRLARTSNWIKALFGAILFSLALAMGILYAALASFRKYLGDKSKVATCLVVLASIGGVTLMGKALSGERERKKWKAAQMDWLLRREERRPAEEGDTP